MANLIKALVAEFIGTFALVFLGAGAGVMLGTENSPTGLISVALAHGLTLMIFGYAYGHISGTHINPAVTLGLTAAGKIEPLRALYYIITQIVGGIVAAFVLYYIFYGRITDVSLGVTVIDYNLTDIGGAFVLEMIGAFLLVNTVLNAAVSGRAGNFGPLAIGLTLAVCIMFYGPITGASVNPARTIGPAVVTGIYDDIWVYLVATSLGGILAGVLYRYYLEDPVEPATPASPVAPPTSARTTPPASSRRRR